MKATIHLKKSFPTEAVVYILESDLIAEKGDALIISQDNISVVSQEVLRTSYDVRSQSEKKPRKGKTAWKRDNNKPRLGKVNKIPPELYEEVGENIVSFLSKNKDSVFSMRDVASSIGIPSNVDLCYLYHIISTLPTEKRTNIEIIKRRHGHLNLIRYGGQA